MKILQATTHIIASCSHNNLYPTGLHWLAAVPEALTHKVHFQLIAGLNLYSSTLGSFIKRVYSTLVGEITCRRDFIRKQNLDKQTRSCMFTFLIIAARSQCQKKSVSFMEKATEIISTLSSSASFLC